MQLSDETDCEPIDIAARLSDRVPFGTGAAVGRIMELEDPAREFLLYHPSVFGLLRSWLGSLPAFMAIALQRYRCNFVPGARDRPTRAVSQFTPQWIYKPSSADSRNPVRLKRCSMLSDRVRTPDSSTGKLIPGSTLFAPSS